MKDKSNYGGPGTLSVLTIVLVTLKLIGVINWSWWWVLAPIWGQILIAVVIIGAGIIVGELELRKEKRND